MMMTFLLAVLVSPDAAHTAMPPCVGVVLPSVRGAEGDATATATSLRELLTSYLSGPTLRVMSLDSRLAAQAIEEAREKECANVLTITVTRTRHDGGGIGRALGRAASGAAWQMPYGGSATTAAVRGAAIAGAYAVSELASSTKARDELTIDYRVTRHDSPAAPAKREHLKAKADGEDLVTPLVERIAESVVAAIGK
jgi:hypothetical protein